MVDHEKLKPQKLKLVEGKENDGHGLFLELFSKLFRSSGNFIIRKNGPHLQHSEYENDSWLAGSRHPPSLG